MKKIIPFITLALILSIAPLGSSVKLDNHRVRVEVNENNEASIKETFKLRLDSDKESPSFGTPETEAFQSLSSKGVEDLKVWANFYEKIRTTYTGNINNISVSTSIRSKSYLVIIDYKPEKMVNLTSQRGRIKNYKMNMGKLRFYEKGTGLVIPDNTNLWINLPDSLPEKSVEVSSDPINSFEGHEMYWNTGRYGKLDIIYQKKEPISSWSFEGAIEAFKKTFIGNPVYGGVLIILISLSIIYRDQIKLLFSEGLSTEEEAEKPKRKI